MAVTLELMSEARLQPWLETVRSDYVESRLAAGETREQATANADRSFEATFRDGVPRPGHHIYDVVSDGEPVGYLWLGPQTPPSPGAWWVWDVAVQPEHQRRGYGRQAMLLAETEIRRLGGRVLGLNVFGFNVGARQLYESLGYETTAVQMRKELWAQPG